MLRDLQGDEQFADFSKAVEDARSALDGAADERGQPTERRGPELGSRVQRPERDAEQQPRDSGDGTGDSATDASADGRQPARKGRMPPQFMRGR